MMQRRGGVRGVITPPAGDTLRGGVRSKVGGVNPP
jgi:hypothetical protein